MGIKLLQKDDSYNRFQGKGKLRKESFYLDRQSDDEGFGDEVPFIDNTEEEGLNDGHSNKTSTEKTNDDTKNSEKKRRKKSLARSLRKGTKNFGNSVFSLFRFRKVFGNLNVGRFGKTRKYQSTEKLV